MGDKPRILQICHDYKGPFRTVARQYAASFSDCEVRTVFLRGPQSASLASTIPGEVDFFTLPEGSLRGLKIEPFRQLCDLVGESVPDLVLAHRYKPFYLASMLNYQLDIGAVIGVMHEYGFLGRGTRSFLSRFWKDNVYLIGVSQSVSEEVINGQPHLKDRVHTVGHAIEAGELVDAVTARHDLGIPLGSYCYGTVGRLVGKKNHRLLIEAFALLEGDSVLAIVGEGELKNELKQLSRKLGLSERVVFCGGRDEARRYMKAFDSFVLSSSHEEAFGMVLLEAMSASVPIICSDAPGPASVIADAGLSFRSGDTEDLVRQMKVMRSLTAEEQEELTKKALQRLGQNYSVAVIVEHLRNLPPVMDHAPVSW